MDEQNTNPVSPTVAAPAASPPSPASSAAHIAPAASATPAVPKMMVGRWIWFGLQRFDEAAWDAICRQAASWQVQGLHPKVADGVNRWYDDAGLLMLRQVAERHGLRVVPYHYCYGPQFGAGQIPIEAQISAWAGKVFGAVIPDIEDQYMGQYGSAESFGRQVRSLFKGLWMPTLYANPKDHPVPLLSLNPYMDAWLPQVYFAEWNGIAQSAIDYVYPQWQYFDQRARQLGQGSLKPILPIISLENGVAAAQIADFIRQMQAMATSASGTTTLTAPMPAPSNRHPCRSHRLLPRLSPSRQPPRSRLPSTMMTGRCGRSTKRSR